MLLKPISIILLTLFLAGAKVYERCELARELRNFDLPEDEIPTWVCIAQYESHFDTAAMNLGSGDHGLFQISQIYWCSPPGNGYGCNSPCSKFRDDDIADDLRCIRRIYNEHTRISGDGFNAWVVYPLYCKNTDNSKYVHGCFDQEPPITPDIPVNATENEIPYEQVDEFGDGYHFPPLPNFSKAGQDNSSEQLDSGNVYKFPDLPFSRVSIHDSVSVKEGKDLKNIGYNFPDFPFSKQSIHDFVPVGITAEKIIPTVSDTTAPDQNDFSVRPVYSKHSIHYFVPVSTTPKNQVINVAKTNDEDDTEYVFPPTPKISETFKELKHDWLSPSNTFKQPIINTLDKPIYSKHSINHFVPLSTLKPTINVDLKTDRVNSEQKTPKSPEKPFEPTTSFNSNEMIISQKDATELSTGRSVSSSHLTTTSTILTIPSQSNSKITISLNTNTVKSQKSTTKSLLKSTVDFGNERTTSTIQTPFSKDPKPFITNIKALDTSTTREQVVFDNKLFTDTSQPTLQPSTTTSTNAFTLKPRIKPFTTSIKALDTFTTRKQFAFANNLFIDASQPSTTTSQPSTITSKPSTIISNNSFTLKPRLKPFTTSIKALDTSTTRKQFVFAHELFTDTSQSSSQPSTTTSNNTFTLKPRLKPFTTSIKALDTYTTRKQFAFANKLFTDASQPSTTTSHPSTITSKPSTTVSNNTFTLKPRLKPFTTSIKALDTSTTRKQFVFANKLFTDTSQSSSQPSTTASNNTFTLKPRLKPFTTSIKALDTYTTRKQFAFANKLFTDTSQPSTTTSQPSTITSKPSTIILNNTFTLKPRLKPIVYTTLLATTLKPMTTTKILHKSSSSSSVTTRALSHLLETEKQITKDNLDHYNLQGASSTLAPFIAVRLPLATREKFLTTSFTTQKTSSAQFQSDTMPKALSTFKRLPTTDYKAFTTQNISRTTTDKPLFTFKPFSTSTSKPFIITNHTLFGPFKAQSTTRKPLATYKPIRNITANPFTTAGPTHLYSTTSNPLGKQLTFAPDSFFSWIFGSQTLPPLVPPGRPPRPSRPPGNRPGGLPMNQRPRPERPGALPRPPRPGGIRPGVARDSLSEPQELFTTRPNFEAISTGRSTRLKQQFSFQQRADGVSLFTSKLLDGQKAEASSTTSLTPFITGTPKTMTSNVPSQKQGTIFGSDRHPFSNKAGRSKFELNSDEHAVEVKLNDNFVFLRTRFGYRLFRNIKK